MSLILLFTGLAGFLTSFSLLHLGVLGMGLRYPIAILISYGVFLLLLRLWLWANGRRLNLDLDPSGLDSVPSQQLVERSFHFGGGGDFGGAGAGGSWGDSAASAASDGVDVGLDLEELWLIIIALVAMGAALIAALYIVYIAPVLLAEILVDGVLMVGLYRRIRNIERRHWLQSAVRQTLLPALVVTVLFAVAGYTLHKAVPEAHSIGEVWKQIR